MRQTEIEQKGAILSAYLVESYRKEGKPRHRVLKYLASIGEGYIATRSTRALIDFWTKENASLAELDKLSAEPQELAFFLGFRKESDQFGHTIKSYFLSLSTSGNAQGRTQMRLASTIGTDQQDVLPLVEIFSFEQFEYQGLVHTGTGLEVEGVKRLRVRKLGGLEAAIRSPTLPFD